MMGKHWIAFALCLFFSIPLNAQDFPRAEIYGGYQLLQVNNSGFESSFGSVMNGLAVAGEVNIKRWLGIVGDMGYGTKSYVSSGATSKLSQLNLLTGPRVSCRGGKLRVFGHALFGLNRKSYSYSYPSSYSHEQSANDLSAAFGGGLDLPLGKNASFRPFQVDMIITGGLDQWVGIQHQFRYTIGFVFKFGAVRR
jgi:hypothetical protein